MKTLLLFLLPLGIVFQSFSQSKTDTIKLNFQTKHFEGIDSLEKIKRGEFYQLKITHINMNLFKVIIETKDTTITSAITFPSFDMVNLGGIGDVLSKLSEITSSTKAMQPQIIPPIQTRIKEESLFLTKKLQEIQICQDSLESLTLSIQMKILSYSILDTTKTYYEVLSKSIEIDSMLTKTTRLRTNISVISNEIKKHQSDYIEDNADDKTQNLIANKPELKKMNAILLESFTSSISLVNKLSESISIDKIMTLLTILINKDNNKSDYISLPQQLNGSETKLKITIAPLKEEYGLPSYITTIKFPQRKKIYVGIGMGFYGATFKNNTYSTSATVIDSTRTDYKIVNEDNPRGEIGLVTLLHFGVRPGKKQDWFALNFVTGPALSFTTTVKPRIALGGGVSFGRYKQMLSISALYMAGYVDQKSNIYDVNTIYNSKPETVTVNKLAGAFGLSVGYIYKF